MAFAVEFHFDSPFNLSFSSAGHFGVNDAIILLKPYASKELDELRAIAVDVARSSGLLPRHIGAEWVPHTALATTVSPSRRW